MVQRPDIDELEFSDEELVQILKNHGVNRRKVLGALGAGGLATLLGSGSAMAQESAPSGQNAPAVKNSQSSPIDPHFGYAGTKGSNVPVQPDHTVHVYTHEPRFVRDQQGKPIGVRFGGFHYDPVGLAIQPNDVVKFKFDWPEHMIASYTERMGRQRRVPSGTPSFASPVMSRDDFWLYQFTQGGVYDMFCPPHERYGMAMRIVVGSQSTSFGPANPQQHERPPEGISNILLGLNALSPTKIRNASNGMVSPSDLYNISVPVPSKSDETPLGKLAVPLDEPEPASDLPDFTWLQ